MTSERPTTRRAWVEQCAAHLRKFHNYEYHHARQCAAHLADGQMELNGASMIAWAKPEDAAEEMDL